MDLTLLALVVVAAFVTLLFVGRRQIAAGANPQLANGAVLLVLGAILGFLALGIAVSLDVW